MNAWHDGVAWQAEVRAGSYLLSNGFGFLKDSTKSEEEPREKQMDKGPYLYNAVCYSVIL